MPHLHSEVQDNSSESYVELFRRLENQRRLHLSPNSDTMAAASSTRGPFVVDGHAEPRGWHRSKGAPWNERKDERVLFLFGNGALGGSLADKNPGQ